MLQEARAGDDRAAGKLWGAVYDELRRIAHRELGGGYRASETMSTTALVHEAYLKLVDGARAGAESRTHFFALSCRAMRQILIDHARRRMAQKRGGGAAHIPLENAVAVAEERAEALLALDEALTRLAALDPRLEQVVECRYFGGLSVEETAAIVGTSPRTVERDWSRAKAYLMQAVRTT